MKLSNEEVVDALLAAAEKKALALAAIDDLTPAGSAADMGSAVEQPTTSVAAIRAIRADQRAKFAADPAGQALKLTGPIESLLGLIGIGG